MVLCAPFEPDAAEAVSYKVEVTPSLTVVNTALSDAGAIVETWPSEKVVAYELLDLVIVSTSPFCKVARYMNAPPKEDVCELE